MNDNLCIALITTASIFAGFLVAFLSSYLTTRNREYDKNRQKFDALGRKLTLFRQLCGFIWTSDCLDEQRRKQKQMNLHLMKRVTSSLSCTLSMLCTEN